MGFELATLIVGFGAAIALAIERLRLKRRERELRRAHAALATANEMLAEQASHDGLTGLHNRRHFFHVLQAEFERARRHRRPLSVLMLDIDNFKSVNDKHGHLQGDHVLAELGKVFSSGLRQSDVVARYGGDEFAFLLPETEESSAMRVAEKLREAVADASIFRNGTRSDVTISIGVAGLNDSLASEDALVNQVDSALYFAKDCGRNRVEGGTNSSAEAAALDEQRPRQLRPAEADDELLVGAAG
ncbi:MAG: GGDEF domain-containing protein [Dehalococcoidia bacterium]